MVGLGSAPGQKLAMAPLVFITSTKRCMGGSDGTMENMTWQFVNTYR